MHKAQVDDSLAPEILDIVQMLERDGVIEIHWAAPLWCQTY